MASLEEIYKEITDAFIEDDTVIAKYGLDTTKTFDEQFSKFAIERIIFYTVAFVIYVREKSLDKWLKEVEARDTALNNGGTRWRWRGRKDIKLLLIQTEGWDMQQKMSKRG